MKSIIQRLSPELFWDTDVSQVKPRRHEGFIVQRVLRFGSLRDWQAARRYYGLAAARRVLRAARDLDPKSREFWRVVLSSGR